MFPLTARMPTDPHTSGVIIRHDSNNTGSGDVLFLIKFAESGRLICLSIIIWSSVSRFYFGSGDDAFCVTMATDLSVWL